MENMRKQYIARAKNELTEHFVYHKLALREKMPVHRDLLEALSRQEKEHYEFWRSLVPDADIKPRRMALAVTPLVRAVFGITFTAKFLESHEEDSIATYEAMYPNMAEEHKARLQKIIEDEKSHERALIGQIRERRISYIGFIALGLADAIVEITGVHAGFLGVTGSTLIAGVSGLIVGFAAAISMGSAAYIQAKQDAERSPVVSAFATGISYISSVVLLAFPYFLIKTMITAFVVSSSIGVLLLASFTFYGAVVSDRKFLREFSEAALLMFGTAGATFLLGDALGKTFHVNATSF